jgi:hypothetical protein
VAHPQPTINVVFADFQGRCVSASLCVVAAFEVVINRHHGPDGVAVVPVLQRETIKRQMNETMKHLRG